MPLHFFILKKALGVFLLVLCWFVHAQNTFQSIEINTQENPRGYWEFLPESYYSELQNEFAILIFFHGLGSGGNGNSELDRVLSNGPPELVNLDLENNVFGEFEVIMLAPQLTENSWWNENHMRPFLDYALSNYRVDRQRIYFTGLSAGSSGIHQFMNDDEHAHQLAGILTTAVRGQVDREKGAYLAELIPYWGLTARGDASNTLINSANRMAGHLQGIEETDLMDNYINDGNTYTASYKPDNGWVWLSGAHPVSQQNPLVTLYPGSSHETWNITYENHQVWQWLFSQVKPELKILYPVDGSVIPDLPVSMEGVAVDVESNVLTNIEWYSDKDGFLGLGSSITATLSPGAHWIEAWVSDAAYRGDIQHVMVTVDPNMTDIIYVSGFELIQP